MKESISQSVCVCVDHAAGGSVQNVKWSNDATAICNVLVLCFAIVFIDGVINRVLASLICSSTDEQFRWNAQGRLNVETVSGVVA